MAWSEPNCSHFQGTVRDNNISYRTPLSWQPPAYAWLSFTNAASTATRRARKKLKRGIKTTNELHVVTASCKTNLPTRHSPTPTAAINVPGTISSIAVRRFRFRSSIATRRLQCCSNKPFPTTHGSRLLHHSLLTAWCLRHLCLVVSCQD